MKRIWFHFVLILLIGTATYAKVSSAYFCGYDDFGETHRAVFEDAGNPSRIFTTTHFGTTKYRPLNRLSTLLCWKIGGGSALPFRLRNLFFHLICALAVYGITLKWTRQHEVALVAGLFFCLEPIANQNVVATVFTNTAAYAFLLTGFLFFLVWTESKRTLWLALSLLLVLIGMFYYEPVIVIFPMMAVYLFLEKWRSDKAPTSTEMLICMGGSFGVLLVFGFSRYFVVHGRNVRVPFPTMIHNAILYAGGLLAPIDVVTDNQLFGSPLPPEMHWKQKILLLLLIVVVALGLGLLALVRMSVTRAAIHRLDKVLILFLALSIPIALGPFILFTPHASETYLYLPVALYCILLSTMLKEFLPSRSVYRFAVVAILLWFGVGTWIRNQRVVGCGHTAREILTHLPLSRWSSGDWHIYLSNVSGQMLSPRYGVYAYKGLSTIDPGDLDTGSGAQNALQVATGNLELKAEVVPSEARSSSCTGRDACFEVFNDGSIHEFDPVGHPGRP